MDNKNPPPPHYSTTLKYEEPVQIANFRHLLDAVLQCSEWSHARLNARTADEAGEAAHDDKTQMARIQPHDQLFFIEARGQDVSSFNVNADLLCIFGDGRNRWLKYNKTPCDPPQALKVARLVMSPVLCALWQSRLTPTSYDSPFHGLDLMHLIIVQGLAGAEVRKFIAVETFHEAASTVFHELANGFSVVFVGLMFKAEFENRMLHGRAYQICRSVEELKHWQNHAVMPGGTGPLPPPAPSSASQPLSASTTSSPKARSSSKDKDKESKRGREGKELPEEPKRFLGIIC